MKWEKGLFWLWIWLSGLWIVVFPIIILIYDPGWFSRVGFFGVAVFTLGMPLIVWCMSFGILWVWRGFKGDQ